MAQWVKALAGKPDDLISIPGIDGDGENPLLQAAL